MSGSGSSSSGCAPKQAIAFGQHVKRAVPNGHLNSSISCDEGIFHNPFCDSRFKKAPVTVIYSQQPHLGEPPDLPVEALQSPQGSGQSEIKIVQVWSMSVEKDSNSVDNSHQYSNLMGQVRQIFPADNLSHIDVSQTVQTQESLVHSEAVAINKYVSNSSEKKTARLKRQREHKRELRKDPAFAKRERERQRERQRERRKDPAYAERERKCQRERQRVRYQTDPDYAERKRECSRKRYQTDPGYAERQRERYQKDPDYAERKRARQRELRKDFAYAKHQRKRKNRHCQSVNSAETIQSSSKNSEGTAPRFSVVKLKEYLQSRSAPLSLSERSAIEESEDTGHCPLDRQTA